MFFFKPRIHESVAIAAALSVAITLHGFWIANLLIIRLPSLSSFFKSLSDKDMISSLYLFGLVLFLVAWCVLFLIFKGRDCSHYRDSTFLFLVLSVSIFFVMTLPVVFSFSF